jgi:hypothetical protein
MVIVRCLIISGSKNPTALLKDIYEALFPVPRNPLVLPIDHSEHWANPLRRKASLVLDGLLKGDDEGGANWKPGEKVMLRNYAISIIDDIEWYEQFGGRDEKERRKSARIELNKRWLRGPLADIIGPPLSYR